MSEEMQTEIEKRIEAELESIWNGERKGVEYKFKNFDTGFKAGAKFILEMPELRDIRNTVINIHNLLLDYYSEPDVYWDNPDRAFEKTKEAVELLLQSAQVVYGSTDTPSDQLAWSNTQLDCDTHKAILLAIEPIKKKTKAEAALELLEKLAKDHDKLIQPEWHVKEAKRILEMKDEV